MSKLKPHLSFAEPNATCASWIETFHFCLYSGSAYVSISLLKSFTMLKSHSCIFSGESRSSLIRRSILLMYMTGRTLSSRACLSTVSVWVIMPSTASTTTIAPSTALRLRVTLPVKSMCPGVSIRLMTYGLPSFS